MCVWGGARSLELHVLYITILHCSAPQTIVVRKNHVVIGRGSETQARSILLEAYTLLSRSEKENQHTAATIIFLVYVCMFITKFQMFLSPFSCLRFDLARQVRRSRPVLASSFSTPRLIWFVVRASCVNFFVGLYRVPRSIQPMEKNNRRGLHKTG